MEDDTEFSNLPTEEMCVHKLWKARVQGYENAAKLFKQIDDDKSSEWSKYLGLIKKFVTDSNALAQEKGLEAALAFIENCAFAGKTVGEVMSGIVTKCVAAPKTKTKELALQVILMFVEIEKHEATVEELIKGMEHKNPRIVSACIVATTTALKQFGNKVISIKLLVKKISTILTDRDKDVRTEGKALVVEMHRWIGAALEPHISQLQPVVLQELREAFAEGGSKAIPERYLRSQQAKSAIAVQEQHDGGDDNNDEGEEDEDAPDVDPYDLLDPVDILSKLPKDFFDKLEAKKWQDRKEALDALEGLLKSAPKLEQGDYGDIVRALKKVISKDTNVLLVALSGKCVSLMALGLKKKFQTYSTVLFPCIFEKFKEKKVNVVTNLREAVDAMFQCTTIETIADDIIEALGNKNPHVKSETAAFLTRAIVRTQPAALNKKLLKVLVPALLKVLESAEPTVRDHAAEVLGTATKLVGEKNISPFIGKLDNLKEQKIQEYCEKAVILVKVVGPKKEARPKTAPEAKAGSAQPKPVKRPTTGAVKKPGVKKTSPSDSAKPSDRSDEFQEREISMDDVEAKAEELLGPAFMNDITDVNWKVRLEAVQNLSDMIAGWTSSDVNSQVLYKIINKKPGLKDNNSQSLKMRLEIVKNVAASFPISSVAVDHVLPDIVEKLSEPKCSQLACEALTQLSEATSLDYVANQALEYAMDKQKNPKVQTEIFEWLTTALLEFGNVLNVKSILNNMKKAIAATNPAIRSGGMSFLSTLYRYTGASLYNAMDSVKIQVKPPMKQEIEKYADMKPPLPVRGVKKSASKQSMGDDLECNDDQGDDDMVTPVQDVRVAVDISPMITEALINEMNDKNWKVRNEALEKVKNIISNAQSIKPSIGELPQALALRLVDSNSKIGQLSLQICEAMVVAMGPRAKMHIRVFFPGFFQGLGDSKTWIRSASLQCINEWASQCGVPAIFDGEIVFDALKMGSPILRAELWTWLAEKLPIAPPKSIPREELTVCIPLLFAALEDRGAEVRRGAGEAVLGFMMHLGPESMTRQAEKLKPGSKSVVQTALDKAKPNLPIQPLPKGSESKVVKSGAPVKSGGQNAAQSKTTTAKATKGVVKSASTSSTRSKKDDDNESVGPLLSINNLKHQRMIDEQKLKVLKWNFTTPREEFFDLLKDQLTTAGVNKTLISNMFHADFRYHIKSIESLIEDLQENGSATVANLDLIFKWLTLRFFDTNPSVLLRGLDYLNAVFSYLINENYQMTEYEAQCFIPYLVLKVGDPKDTVRNGVKSLLRQICMVYSVSKLFGYLMEGLKSKNARQRTECLEVLGLLIESFGVAICNPSPAAALKEVAKQISDRDNSVRNAALNCVVQAYYLEGEKVYKMIGQISDKDHSLLEERIKRAAKSKDTNRKTMLFQPAPPARSNQNDTKDTKPAMVEVEQSNDYEDDEEDPEDDYLPPPTRIPSKPEPAARPVSGQFGLDPSVLAAIESESLIARNPEIQEVDLAFLDEPTSVPAMIAGHPLATGRPITNLMPLSPPSRLSLQPLQPSALPQPSQPLLLSESSPLRYEQDNLLSRTIQSIGNANLAVAINALAQMEGILRTNHAVLMSAYEEQLLIAMIEQFKKLRRSGPTMEKQELCTAYSYLISVLNLFYEGKITGKNVSSATIGGLIDQLLRLLVSRILEKDGDDNLVRAVNSVCVKMLDRSEHTALICALVTLLQNSVGGDPSSARYQELEMKCLWKVMKMMPNWDCETINYDQVLYKLHQFFKAYPSAYWKKNSQLSDTPYRTIKTLVNSILKKKGSSIMNHVSLIPDFKDSELHHYMIKLFKSMKLDEHKKENVPVAEGSPIKMPRLVHEELSQILKRIGEKQHSKEALRQLYDLRERNPTVDIWVHLKDASNLFRTYIERGLKEVAEERRTMRGDVPPPVSIPSLPLPTMPIMSMSTGQYSDSEAARGHMHHLEKLRALQAKAGMVADSASNSQPRTPVIDNRSLADSIDDGTKHNIDPKFDLPTLHQQSSRKEPQMELLRQKLQKIKSANR